MVVMRTFSVAFEVGKSVLKFDTFIVKYPVFGGGRAARKSTIRYRCVGFFEKDPNFPKVE